MRKKIIWVALILIVLGGILAFPTINLFLKSRKTTINKADIEFYIKNSMDLKRLAKELKNAGILEEENGFIDVGEYKGIEKKSIALGKYVIKSGSQYRTILNGFKLNAAGNGNGEVEVDVTFNNCRDIKELSGKVSQSLMLDSTELYAYLEDKSTLKRFGFTKEQFPAMFLPNTYKMYYDTDPIEFTERMAEEFKTFWTPERKGLLKKIGLKSPSEAVTLASIVYSEQSNHPEEWPIIAGLYLNRIKQGTKLQSDPTFKFCWGDKLKGVQRLLYVHRDIDCAYNTYIIQGLPPGPICIPPSEVVNAVLNRDDNNYIFMMARPDFSGKHDFSVDYTRHQKLAKIYQNWLEKTQKKN